MTTKSTKPTVRETSAYVREKGLRPVIATIHHGLLTLKPKGLKNSTYTVDIGAVWQQACKAHVLSIAAEKRKAKAAKRAGNAPTKLRRVA